MTPPSLIETLAAMNRRTLALVAAVVVMLAVVVTGGWWFGDRQRPVAQVRALAVPLAAAVTACREAVKLRLRSPSTAAFGDEVLAPSGSGATVKGWVDAQNGFGATVRNRYSCFAWRGTAWRVESVDFFDW